MTREELAGKVEWEGGIAEAITGYGLPASCLPDDVPWEVYEAWQRLSDARHFITTIEGWLYDQA